MEDVRKLVTLPSTALLDEVISVIERDGGVIIENFLTAEVLDQLRSDIYPAIEACRFGNNGVMGTATRRVGALAGITPTILDIADNPLFVGSSTHFLDEPHEFWAGEEKISQSNGIRIGHMQAIAIYPEQGAQGIHRDDALWAWPHPDGGGPQARLQVMVAVTDFTPENGATLVIPGSHKWGEDRAPKEDEVVPAAMKAGSGLIYFGGTYHAGGRNKTDERRVGVIVALDRAHLRLEENHYIGIPHEAVLKMPDRLLELLGYSIGMGGAGFVVQNGIAADPIDMLRGQEVNKNTYAFFDNKLQGEKAD